MRDITKIHKQDKKGISTQCRHRAKNCVKIVHFLSETNFILHASSLYGGWPLYPIWTKSTSSSLKISLHTYKIYEIIHVGLGDTFGQSPGIFYTHQASIVVDQSIKYEQNQLVLHQASTTNTVVPQFKKKLLWLLKFGMETNAILHASPTYGT